MEDAFRWSDGTPIAAAPLVRTTDLDELVDDVTELMSEHVVVPAQRTVRGRVDGFTSPDLSMLLMDYGTPLRVEAEPLPGYLALCLPLRSSMGVRHGGRTFEAGDGSAFLGSAASTLEMDWRESLQLLVMRLELAPLTLLAERVGATDEAELAFDPEVPLPVASAVAGQVRLLHDVAQGSTPNPLAAAQLREQAMYTLLLGQRSTWSAQLRQRPPRTSRDAIADAVDLMRLGAGDPLTISDVAAAVGLSVRGLHAGFRRDLGVAPKQFLQRVRLDGAYADLLRAAPDGGVRVLDVAVRWGFPHTGRFAAAYRARHGESPSETLVR